MVRTVRPAPAAGDEQAVDGEGAEQDRRQREQRERWHSHQQEHRAERRTRRARGSPGARRPAGLRRGRPTTREPMTQPRPTASQDVAVGFPRRAPFQPSGPADRGGPRCRDRSWAALAAEPSADRDGQHHLARMMPESTWPPRPPQTQANVARKTAEGHSRLEILRCLTCYLARECCYRSTRGRHPRNHDEERRASNSNQTRSGWTKGVSGGSRRGSTIGVDPVRGV